MKHLLILILFAPLLAYAQQTPLTVLQKDGAGRFRYASVYTADTGTEIDTIEIRYLPSGWADTSAFQDFTVSLIDYHAARNAELRRMAAEAADERDFYISSLDSTYGAGTWKKIEKQRVYESLQGDWRLIEKNQSNRPAGISADTITVGAKVGTITYNADLTFTMAGIYTFNLTFNRMPNGQWRAIRNERVFILRKHD